MARRQSRMMGSRPMSSEARADRNQRSFMWHAQRYGGLVLLCTVIWALSGFGYFWPVWPLGFMAVSAAKRGRRHDQYD
jgi:uncharacterized membrane protein YccC